MKMFVIFISLLFSLDIAFAQNFWQKTSFPSGSQLNSVYSILGLEDNSVLFGTFGMGIYKTTDNGLTFFPSGLNSQWIIDLKKDANQNIYALTVGSAFGSGVFKSTDNGLSWNQVWSYQGGFNCLYVDQSNNIYVGLNFSGGQGGVYKSTNQGGSWTNIFPYPANVYAITKTIDGTLLLAVYEDGLAHIYKSTNEGSTWLKHSFTINFTSTDFAVDYQGRIFLSTAGYGIYRSTNNGQTWENVAPVGPDFSCLFVDKNTVYAGSKGNYVFRSTNSGSSWNLWNSGMGTDNYVLSLGASKSGFLFAGMDYYGIYRSVNNIVEVESEKISPAEFKLYQNYPNPFNPKTKFYFTLSENGLTELKIYNLIGQEKAVIISDFLNSGKIYEYEYDASNLPSGIYLAKLSQGRKVSIRKIILIK